MKHGTQKYIDRQRENKRLRAKMQEEEEFWSWCSKNFNK